MRDPNKSMKKKKIEKKKKKSLCRSSSFSISKEEKKKKRSERARAHVHPTTIEWDFFIMSHKADYKWRHGSFPSFTSTARKQKKLFKYKKNHIKAKPTHCGNCSALFWLLLLLRVLHQHVENTPRRKCHLRRNQVVVFFLFLFRLLA